jgi:hypothetical protein
MEMEFKPFLRDLSYVLDIEISDETLSAWLAYAELPNFRFPPAAAEKSPTEQVLRRRMPPSVVYKQDLSLEKRERRLRQKLNQSVDNREISIILSDFMTLPWVADRATFLAILRLRDGEFPSEIKLQADLTLREKIRMRSDLPCLAEILGVLDAHPILSE